MLKKVNEKVVGVNKNVKKITGKPMTQAKWNEACERNRKRNLKEVLFNG